MIKNLFLNQLKNGIKLKHLTYLKTSNELKF